MAGPYALSGSGIQTIAQPASLIVSVTAQPLPGRNGKANPVNLYDVALLTPGNPSGWYAAIPVSENPMVIPLPAGCTRLGYACLYGSQLSVAEVAPTLANSSLEPWDRNPTFWSNEAVSQVGSPVGLTVMWTYTVPAGRKLWVSILQCELSRQTSFTQAGGANCYIRVNSARIIEAYDYGGNAASVFQSIGPGSVLVLPAGSIIDGVMNVADSGGSLIVRTGAAGFTFDA